MIADWQTNKIFFSKYLEEYKEFYQNFKRVLDEHGCNYDFLSDTKDIWARDYMPIQIAKDKFIQYKYEPSYLKGKFSHRKTDPNKACNAIGLKKRKRIETDIILDGGNVVKSESTIILTDRVFDENEISEKEKQDELRSRLKEIFEVGKVVIIPQDKKCLYGHADGMLRFIEEDKVLVSGFYNYGKFFKELKEELENHNIAVEVLDLNEKGKAIEDNIYYINFLQTADIILAPALNREEDSLAFEKISEYFPKYAAKKKIVPIDVREIAEGKGKDDGGGGLNCISWTIKE